MSGISKEYAAALFDLARENGSEEPIGEGVKYVAAVVRSVPQVLDFLSAPNIPMKERIGVIENALKDNVPEYVLSFTQLLCEHGHIREIEKCAEDYEELMNAARGLSTARVVSATALTEDQKRQLQQRLSEKTGRKVVLDCSVDESLLGGLVVTLDGKVMDGSLKHRLNEVREVMNR
jgi:F-type H+-transporting ATPase subunit delta